MTRKAPATKKTLKERVEELQARSRDAWMADKPKWTRKPRILQHIKEAEMVSLDRKSDFAKIPAELQLHVISYLDYHDVLHLKRTGRYFNYFINDDVIKESRLAQIQAYQSAESKHKLPLGSLPCYKCLKMKPSSEYWNKTGNYYLNNQPYNYARNPNSYTPDYNRYCIPCSFMEGRIDPGVKLLSYGRPWLICASCFTMDKGTGADPYSYPTTVCKPCQGEFKFMSHHGLSLRIAQWMVAVVILPLACTGRAMPWTSRADEHSLRWIFTITLDLLSIGGLFASMCTRLQSNGGTRYSNKRSENAKFVFLVEFTALLLWTGVLTALFIEARDNNWTGRYDRFAKGLTAMILIEVLMFVVTTLWSNRYTRELVLPQTKRPKLRSLV